MERGQRLQDVHIDVKTLRDQVRAQHFTFDDIGDYLAKYHGLKNFELVRGGRNGDSIELTIRRIGRLERLKNWLKAF